MLPFTALGHTCALWQLPQGCITSHSADGTVQPSMLACWELHKELKNHSESAQDRARARVYFHGCRRGLSEAHHGHPVPRSHPGKAGLRRAGSSHVFKVTVAAGSTRDPVSLRPPALRGCCCPAVPGEASWGPAGLCMGSTRLAAATTLHRRSRCHHCHQRRLKSSRATRAALRPAAPITPPPAREQKWGVVGNSSPRRWGPGLHWQSCPTSLPVRGQRGVDTPPSHAALASLPHAPALLLQPPRSVLAPSPAHQGGLRFHTGTSQELGTGSPSRMVPAGQSTAGPESSLHGRCSASRALCELAVPGPGLCANQHQHQSDAPA